MAGLLVATGLTTPFGETPAGADLGGLRLVGVLPEKVHHIAGDVFGSYLVDPDNRLLWRYYKIADAGGANVLLKATPLDPNADGSFSTGFEIVIPKGVTSGLVQASGDKPRLDIDIAGMEPVAVVEGAGSRILYAAGGAIYEVDYEPGNGAWSLSKFVAPPNPGAVSERQAFLPSGVSNPTGSGTFVPATGISYAQVGSQPWVFLTGEFDIDLGSSTRGAWISGWDARPGNGAPNAQLGTPEVRQRWMYSMRTCRSLGRGTGTTSQSPVFLSGKWLYAFCDGSTDGSALGVIRLEMSATAGITPGTLSPTGVEEFFPGVTGIEVNAWGDPVQERMYIAGRNVVAGGRSVLVFDGKASDGTGAYIGAFSVALEREPADALGGVDPTSGRWYFQSGEGAWVQEGRLRRVAQATRYVSDEDGGGLAFRPERPVKIDPATADHGARIIVARSGPMCEAYGSQECLAFYEDEIPPSLGETTIGEFTLNMPETPGLVGVYSGSASGFGVRTRVTRGVSTAWPSGLPGVGLETDPPNDPQTVNWYLTDPFFYHGGECGSADRELTFGRVLETKLAGGLSKRDAGAVAIAVDPNIHVPSAADDTTTRDDVADPDPCVRHLYERMTGPNCYGKPGPGEDPNGPAAQLPECQIDNGYGQLTGPFCAEARKNSQWKQFVDNFGDQCAEMGNLEAAGQEWPYEEATCSGDSSPPPEISPPDSSLVRGEAAVACAANAADPTVGATSRVQPTPPEIPSPVSVTDVQTSTKLVRTSPKDGQPGRGLEATSTAVVKGIDIFGLVQIAELTVTATARAEGYAKSPTETTASRTTSRQFRGVTIDGVPLCADDCDEAVVLREANRVLNTYGWLKLAEPEADFTEGTVKGTLAKVQKDLLQQDADRVMNRDFAKEWVGLEVGVYRDAQRRGSGRWIFELGGVFVQTQFTVIRGLSALGPDEATDGGEAPPTVQGSTLKNRGTPAVPASGTESQTFAIRRPFQPTTAASATATGAGSPEERFFSQIAEGIKKSVRMALILGALWTLVYGPVYLARRRNLLKEVAAL